MKGTKRDPAIGAKISAAKAGHSVSAEARVKIGAAAKGRAVSDEHKAAIGNASRKHGMHGTRTYRSWDAMKQRCTNPKNSRWDDYGGRGVAVCSRWLDFANFLADMGVRPSGATLDRIGDGNYEPGKVKWSTDSEQQKNRPRFKPSKARKCEPGCVCGKHRAAA